MPVIDASWEPDSVSLNAVGARSPEWPYGRVRVRALARIDAEYGLSGGAVFRVHVDSEEQADSFSLIVKRESAQAVERALQFHRSVGPRLAGTVPACLGGFADGKREVGLLVLEDIAPAEQGDVLAGCDMGRARSAVRALARVHAASWADRPRSAAADGARWAARPMEPERWAERLQGAAARFPAVIDGALARVLTTLPHRVDAAITSLARGPTCWIHSDAHLDNVLFRPDGRTVLLDWSGAVVGPPAVDLARLLTEGINAGASEDKARVLVTEYASELAACGVGGAPEDAWARLSEGLALLAQAAVGWAGREENRKPRQRMRALQENLLRSVCAWATGPEMTAPGRVFDPTS